MHFCGLYLQCMKFRWIKVYVCVLRPTVRHYVTLPYIAYLVFIFCYEHTVLCRSFVLLAKPWNLLDIVFHYLLLSTEEMQERMQESLTSVVYSRKGLAQCPHPPCCFSIRSRRTQIIFICSSERKSKGRSLRWKWMCGRSWRAPNHATTRRLRLNTASLTSVACWRDWRRWRRLSPKRVMVR